MHQTSAPLHLADSEFPLQNRFKITNASTAALMQHFNLHRPDFVCSDSACSESASCENSPFAVAAATHNPKQLNSNTLFQDQRGQLIQINDIIDAKHIIRTSEVVHGFGHCANLEAIIQQEKQQHPKTLAASHNALFTQFIPANHHKLQANRTGFRQSAQLYFSQLKTHQPYLYWLCFHIASTFVQSTHISHEQCHTGEPTPETFTARGVSTVCAWQDETRLVSGFLKAYQQQQVNNPSQFPVLIFINGQDQAKLAARMAEIQAFLTAQPKHTCLPVLAFSAQLNGWRMGLKCLPVIVGLMHQYLLYPNRDDDFAMNIFDADILKITDSHNLQRKADNVQRGVLNNQGNYHDDESLLAAQNQHYLLIAQLHKSMFRHLIGRATLQQHTLPLHSAATLPLKLYACGANASWSAMAYQLLGGMKAFSHNEVLDFTRLLSRSCEQVFNCHGPLDAKQKNLAWFPSSRTNKTTPNKAENSVLCDGGAVSRSVQSGVPIIEQFNVLAHNRTHLYQLTAMDNTPYTPDNPDNIKRIQQEIGFILAKFLGFNDWVVKQHVNHATQTPWQDATLTALLAQQLSQLAHNFNTLLQPINANVTLQLVAPGSDATVRKNNQDTHPNLTNIPAIHITFNHANHTSEQQIDLAEYQQRYQLSFVNL